MFEDSFVMARVDQSGGSTRWTAAGSIALQCTLASVLIALPLLHPKTLAPGAQAPHFLLPTLKSPEIRTVRTETAAPSPSSTPATAELRRFEAPARIPHGISPGEAPPLPDGLGPGTLSSFSTGLPSALSSLGPAGGNVLVRPQMPISHKAMRISGGVVAGMLLEPIRPVYPRIAIAAHAEGDVLIEAVISREGIIERAHVVSGPALLAGAALEAVRFARYRPFRLNGEPTEVETTIRVNFRLGL